MTHAFRIGSERIDAYPELCVQLKKRDTCILFGSSNKVGAECFMLLKMSPFFFALHSGEMCVNIRYFIIKSLNASEMGSVLIKNIIQKCTPKFQNSYQIFRINKIFNIKL